MTFGPDAANFAEFFAAVNPPLATGERVVPFPWQLDLVNRVAETGYWPRLLDLPTAAGKTAVIDIAVFLMATCETMPRRVAFVIDRRIVVHQAAKRAKQLVRELTRSDNEVVRAVAHGLRSRTATLGASPNAPLLAAELRGGIVRDESWALRPDVPAVLVSTVDQVGSRLLFRGYGVSRGMRPVQAGLLGNDVLFLLDEVHLARPFAETLQMIEDRYRPERGTGIPNRWQVTTLSATPNQDFAEDQVLRLSERDHDAELAPVLARRLAAEKRAVKRLVKPRERDESGYRNALALEAAKTAREMIRTHDARLVGVILNRVNTARRVYDLLRDVEDVDSVLITGRMRAFDRDRLLSRLERRIETGRERRNSDSPLVVVATQSVETGADYDFDALVTECASYDALKQRFGRVDRNGQLSQAGTPSKSVILAITEDVTSTAVDPIYDVALARTWAWLPEQEFDFAHHSPAREQIQDLIATHPQAPKLLPSHLDRWVQTSPYPDASPDIALWLHGISADRALDVNVIWRADLHEDLLAPPTNAADDSGSSAGAALAVSLVTACRPGSGEAMSVPVQAVRAWLARLESQDRTVFMVPVADIEGADPSGDTQQVPGKTMIRPVLRWDGDDSQVVREVQGIRPGDTLIVPAIYGGISAGNWDPDSRKPVEDLGHEVQAEQRLRPVLRLNPDVLARELDVLPDLPFPADADENDESGDALPVAAWLASVDLERLAGSLTSRLIRVLRADDDRTVDRVRVSLADDRSSTVYVVSSKRRMTSAQGGDSAVGKAEAEQDIADSEPETSPFTGSEIPLTVHLADVEQWAIGIARACGLPDRLSEDVGLAARLHDVGKADPRFQAMLRQGRVTGAELLAKSAIQASERADRERARWEAGYPRRGRHELLSVAMVQDNADLATQAHDWDLVLYLVASHHGFCRPFAPVVSDSAPVTAEFFLDGHQLNHSTDTDLARIDSGIAERFWLLVRRYGWFGLAQLEAILRLADHGASADEQVRNGDLTKAKVMA